MQQHTKSFQAVASNVETRLFRFKLNTTNRNLVFRPRRAKELESRREPIVVDGKALEPLKFEGIPGAGALFQLIKSIEGNEERYERLKPIIRDYVTYANRNVNGKHVSLFVRNAASMGRLADSLKYLNHPLFKKLAHSRPVTKEVLRLRSAAAFSNTQAEVVPPQDYAQSVIKAYARAVEADQNPQRCALSTLASVYGLACSASSSSSSSAEAKTLLQTQLDKLAAQFSALPQTIDKKSTMNYEKMSMLADISLGLKGLELAKTVEGINVPADIDTSVLTTLAKECNSTLPETAFSDYFKAVNAAYTQEVEHRRQLAHYEAKKEEQAQE